MTLLNDCDSCMKTNSKQVRQSLGCGYEVPNPAIRVNTWSPTNMSMKWRGEITTCPVFTTNLPAVIEVCRARIHWEKNATAFAAFCEGEPTEQMLAAVEILDGSINEVNNWAMTPKSEGGGRD